MRTPESVVNDFHAFIVPRLMDALNAQIDILMDVGIEMVRRAEKGHRIWVFGSGHSHILAEEWIDKRGSPSFIQTAGLEEVLGHPVKCGIIERDAAFASVVLSLWNVKPGDLAVLISNSGTNGQIVEMALRLKQRRCRVIALTNRVQSKRVSARHSSGRKLMEIADVVLDNHSGDGDAVYEVATNQRMGASSTIIGSALLQALNVVMADVMRQWGVDEVMLAQGLKTSHRIDRQRVNHQLQKFIQRTQKALSRHQTSTLPQVINAGKVAAQAILLEHDCFMFGMGHDHSLVEEIHARAGTLMCNRSLVMHNPETMIYGGQHKSKLYAAIAAYGQAVFEMADPNPGDCFLVISQKFNEPAVMQLCQLALEHHCTVIGLSHTRQADLPAAAWASQITWIRQSIPPLQRIGAMLTGDLSTTLSALSLQELVMAQALNLLEGGVSLPSRVSVNTDQGLISTEAMNRKHFKASIV